MPRTRRPTEGKLCRPSRATHIWPTEAAIGGNEIALEFYQLPSALAMEAEAALELAAADPA